MEGAPPDSVSDGAFFDRLGLLMGAEAVDAFKRLRVAVFGVGGVGGWCAESLVRSGVGHVTVVDSDRVCASNVNRQVMATSRTVGQMKVEALRERLLEINPAAEVVAVARVYSAETADTFDLGSFDYVVDAIDSMRAKAHLINAVTRLERPVLVSSMGAARKTDPFRIRQSEFWTALEDLCFLLELDDADGLVHLCRQLDILLFHRIARHQLGNEFLAGVVAVKFHGEGGQRNEVDAVGLLDSCQVGIAQRHA